MYMIDRRSATTTAAAAIETSTTRPVLIAAVEQGDGEQELQLNKKADEEEREVSFRTTTGESASGKRQEGSSLRERDTS